MGTLVSRLWPAFAGSLLAGALLAWLSGQASWRSALGLALAAWVLAGSAQTLWERSRGADALWARLKSIPGSWWGMWLAHLGIGIFIIGVTLVKTLEANVDVTVKIGSSTQLAGYDFRLEGQRSQRA